MLAAESCHDTTDDYSILCLEFAAAAACGHDGHARLSIHLVDSQLGDQFVRKMLSLLT